MIWTYTYMYKYIYICIYICIFICKYIYIGIYIYTYEDREFGFARVPRSQEGPPHRWWRPRSSRSWCRSSPRRAPRSFFFFLITLEPRAAQKTTQGQIDGFSSRLPFKCHLPEVISVEDWFKKAGPSSLLHTLPHALQPMPDTLRHTPHPVPRTLPHTLQPVPHTLSHTLHPVPHILPHTLHPHSQGVGRVWGNRMPCVPIHFSSLLLSSLELSDTKVYEP